MLADEIASERVTNRLALTAEAFAIFFLSCPSLLSLSLSSERKSGAYNSLCLCESLDTVKFRERRDPSFYLGFVVMDVLY